MNALKGTSAVLVAAGLMASALVGSAQDKPANNLEAVHEQLKADKKVVIGKYMMLTGAEANAFWPVYEAYQSDLQKINQRLVDLLQTYAADYRSNSLSDERHRSCSMSGSPSRTTTPTAEPRMSRRC